MTATTQIMTESDTCRELVAGGIWRRAVCVSCPDVMGIGMTAERHHAQPHRQGALGVANAAAVLVGAALQPLPAR